MTAMMRPAPARRPRPGTDIGTAVQVPERASQPGWPSDPEWLRAARRRAAAWVDAHGFPSIKHEDWRYIKIDAALAMPLTAPPGGAPEKGPAAAAPSDLPAPQLGGLRVVVVNGRVVSDLSAVGAPLLGGVRVWSMAGGLRGLDGRLEQSWARRAGGYPHALRALNDAAALDAAVIDLPAGTVVEAPIEVVFVSVSTGAARWWYPRLIVIAGAEARATLVETYLSMPGVRAVTNALTQVELGAGAELVHYVLQGENTDSFHFSSLEGRLADRSRLSSRLLATGGRIGRHEVDIILAGQGSQVDLDGLFLTGSGQQHDNPVLVEHAAACCTSRQLYKGVVSGDGHGVFNGHLVVHPGADGTDAAQVDKNLLLSERAEVDTRPRLEINACDVVCTHGAAVGQLDPDALFYLRSRGIGERQARAVLVSGFAREILDRFGPGPIRERAEQLALAAGVVTLDDHRHGPAVNSAATAEATDTLPTLPEPPGHERAGERDGRGTKGMPCCARPERPPAFLAAGEQVVVVQRLGASFTVQVGHGALARVAGADADALGIEAPEGDEQGAGEAAAGGREVQPPPDSEGAGWHAPDVEAVLDRLRSVYDPEIPVNVVDLGLIYGCEVHPTHSGGYRVAVWMSMTAPGCGMGDILRAEAAEQILGIPGVIDAEVELVFAPPWDLGRMSEAARLQLGMW